MEKIIKKQNIPRWLEELEQYTVYGPVQVEQEEPRQWGFRELQQPDNLDLDYLNSSCSPKAVVFPQREVLFRFKSNGGEEGLQVEETPPPDRPQVLLGIRPCDAQAIACMDSVFDGDFQDNYYLQRRKKTYLVGLGCAKPPSVNCFCTSVGGSPHEGSGLDVLMTDLGDDYYVESLNPRGVELLSVPGKLFREAKTEERNKRREVQEHAAAKIPRQVNAVEDITARLGEMKQFESDIWEYESMACIRCGICTYLCPSCHCFDITDEVDSPAPLTGKRVRNWDNCQFPDFTMHSSGHNPRPGKASRLRRRILHKFRYFIDTNDRYMCTGCGRCVSQCPVGIDIVDILNRIGE
jgi:ferredoxin